MKRGRLALVACALGGWGLDVIGLASEAPDASAVPMGDAAHVDAAANDEAAANEVDGEVTSAHDATPTHRSRFASTARGAADLARRGRKSRRQLQLGDVRYPDRAAPEKPSDACAKHK